MLQFPEGLDDNAFLANYWQQRPLVFKQGLASAIGVISEHKLLKLACQTDIESRLIKTRNQEQDYALQDGPLTSEMLAALEDDTHWTVLVQSVNLWHKEVAALLSQFSFIPNWRLDDIMISYATDQGSVGPHVDAYDVFLVQIQGVRRWQVAHDDAAQESYTAKCGLNLIADFEPAIDVLLSPGDILYLPPNLAHHGISEGTGMTLSVGFRSPALSQLSMLVTEELMLNERYYRDPDLASETLITGEISQTAMATAHNWFKQHMTSETIAVAFGKLQTQPKQEAILEPLEADVMDTLLNGITISADPTGRLAWWQAKDQIYLFANGEYQLFDKSLLPLIKLLCSLQAIDLKSLSAYIAIKETKQILNFLEDVGYLGIENSNHGTHDLSY